MTCDEQARLRLAQAIEPHQRRWIEENLADNDVPFVVIGGVAVKFYCSARQTGDVDLFLGAHPPLIRRLVAGVPELARDPRAVAKLLNEKVGHIAAPGHGIDVLSFAPGLDFDVAYSTARICQLDGIAIPILSRSLLIAHKRAVGEPKDLNDVELLEQGTSAIDEE